MINEKIHTFDNGDYVIQTQNIITEPNENKEIKDNLIYVHAPENEYFLFFNKQDYLNLAIVINQEKNKVCEIFKSNNSNKSIYLSWFLDRIKQSDMVIENFIAAKSNIFPFKGKYQLFQSVTDYETQLKEVYQNNDWSEFENHYIFSAHFHWFKVAPPIKLKGFEADNSGLESYAEGFEAEYVSQGYCMNAKVAPNCTVDCFYAEPSGLESYPENFKTRVVNQNHTKCKVAPNCELEHFSAIDSELETYPEKFKANVVFQSGCLNAKTAPNCEMESFYALDSGIENYPSKFRAKNLYTESKRKRQIYLV